MCSDADLHVGNHDARPWYLESLASALAYLVTVAMMLFRRFFELHALDYATLNDFAELHFVVNNSWELFLSCTHWNLTVWKQDRERPLSDPDFCLMCTIRGETGESDCLTIICQVFGPLSALIICSKSWTYYSKTPLVLNEQQLLCSPFLIHQCQEE